MNDCVLLLRGSHRSGLPLGVCVDAQLDRLTDFGWMGFGLSVHMLAKAISSGVSGESACAELR